MKKSATLIFVLILIFSNLSSAASISDRRYYLSGILGTTVGFGTGHYIQRRFVKGIIFSATEGVIAAGVLIVLNSHTEIDWNSKSGKTVILTFLGLKLLETLDVWILGSSLRSESASKTTLSPLVAEHSNGDRSYGLSLVRSF